MVTAIARNTTYALEVRVTDASGKGVSGLAVAYEIIRVSSNQGVIQGCMTDIGRGVYTVDIILPELGQYRVLYNLDDYYVDAIETIWVEEPMQTQIDLLKKLLTDIHEVLKLKETPSADAASSKQTYLSRTSDAVFAEQYAKLILNGWVLVKIEGSKYYFER